MEPNVLMISIERARRNTVLLVLVADLLLIALTMIKGYPRVWSEFEKEKNAWTYGCSLQSTLVAAVAYINYLLMSGRLGDTRARWAWTWAFVAFVFLFFGFDDMLILHERGGHAVEGSVRFLSRSHVYFYMDDIIELGYCAVGTLFLYGVLRKVMAGRDSLRLFMFGVASLAAATLIGLAHPVKSMPLPLALIQWLQLLSLYFFFVSFANCAAAEIAAAAKPDGTAISDQRSARTSFSPES